MNTATQMDYATALQIVRAEAAKAGRVVRLAKPSDRPDPSALATEHFDSQKPGGFTSADFTALLSEIGGTLKAHGVDAAGKPNDVLGEKAVFSVYRIGDATVCAMKIVDTSSISPSRIAELKAYRAKQAE